MAPRGRYSSSAHVLGRKFIIEHSQVRSFAPSRSELPELNAARTCAAGHSQGVLYSVSACARPLRVDANLPPHLGQEAIGLLEPL